MYILIDSRAMQVLYRSQKPETLRCLANIEVAHLATYIFDETNHAAYMGYDATDLQNLFKSLTNGTNPYSHNKEYLVGQIARLCQTLEPTFVDGFEATIQSSQIKPTDLSYYRYAYKQHSPAKVTEPYNPPALVGNWAAAQALPLPGTQQSPPAPAQPATMAPMQPTTPPKYAPPWL